MKNAVLLLLACLLVSGCSVNDVVFTEPPAPEDPVANVPVGMRQNNWVSKNRDKYGQGSCVHASTVNVLLWHGEEKMASYWRKKYSGGETSLSICRYWKAEGVPYVSTLNERTYECSGDPAFLQWVSDTRRSCAIWWKPSHCCTFVGFVERDGKPMAAVLDNNYPDRIEYHPVDEFIRKWRGFGGFAICPISPAMPPTTPIPWPIVVPKENGNTANLWNSGV